MVRTYTTFNTVALNCVPYCRKTHKKALEINDKHQEEVCST